MAEEETAGGDQAQSKFAVGAESFGAVLEQIAHPIYIKDRSCRFVLLNDSYCNMVGRRRHEMLGKTDHDLFPKNEADQFRARDIEAFRTASLVKVDSEPITVASGEKHQLAISRVPLRDSTGEVTYLVGIIHDIIKLRSAEEALPQANEEPERRVGEQTTALVELQEELVRKERLAMLGQLAGGLAHQIRNPLAAITNAAYLLQKALKQHGSEELKGPMAIIVEEAWKANRIISGLLDHARVRTPIRYPTNVVRMVRQALAAHPAPAYIKVVEVLRDVSEVAVDPNQVREALGNLVQNAIEAMPTGGTLTVELRAEAEGVVVVVADTGPGVSAEVKRLLFRPLVTTKPFGLGLGLTTAQMLIGNQGGTITLRNTSGHGACFEVWLPINCGARIARAS